MGDRKRRQKGRTWIEASKVVLEKHPNRPMSFREILRDIQANKLKEVSGNGSEACLNAMLHIGSRGQQSLFYKVLGLNGVYGLRHDLPDEAKDLLEIKNDESPEPLPEIEEPMNDEKYIPMKKRPLCGLPRKAHHYIPSLKRFESDPDLGAKLLHTSHADHSKAEHNGEDSSIPRRKSERVLRPKYHHHHKHHRRKTGFVPRIILKPLKPPGDGETNGSKDDFRGNSRRPQTISEILASLHGKTPRRRLPKRNRKLSLKGLERRSLSVDLETPDSKLVHVNTKTLINKHTFGSLPHHYQYKLLKLLPEVDSVRTPDDSLRLRTAALDNEFFTRACSQWRTRLKNGEFTPEMQARLHQELEKERAKVDPWKVDNFEPFWGQSYVNPLANLHAALTSSPPKKPTRPHSVVTIVDRRRTEPAEKDRVMNKPPADPVKTEKKEKIILKLNLKEIKADAAAAAALNSKHRQNSPKKSRKPFFSELDSSKSSAEYVCSQLLTDIANATRDRTGPILNSGQILPSVNMKRPGETLLPRIKDVSVEKRIKHDPVNHINRGRSNNILSARTVAQCRQGQTRTLAQIKAQTLAKAHAHGQTKTLAQIKAQTSARLQQRSPPDRTARPYGHVPTILGKGRTHNFMNLKSIVPTNATAVSLLNNPLGDLSGVLVANQQGELSGTGNQVLAVAVSSANTALPTVKPIIIKAQPGMSLVIVSQPTNRARTVTSKVELINSAKIVKAGGLPPSAVSSALNSVMSTSKVLTSPLPPSERIPSSVDNAQLVKVFAVDPNKSNFVRITEQPNLTRSRVTMHPLSSKEQLINKSTFTTMPGNAMVHLVSPSSLQSQQLQSPPASQPSSVAQANLFISSASPSPVKSIKSSSANQIVAANVTSSNDPMEAKHGPSIECACKLKGLVSCKGCGAYCHHDCINSSNLCVSCLIR